MHHRISTLFKILPVLSLAIATWLLAAQSVYAEDFDQFNPLIIGNTGTATGANSGPSKYAQIFRTPGGVLSMFLQYAFPAAGLILFVMILWGGFEMLSSAASSKGKDAGKQRITAALTGFVLLFASYWMAQLVQIIFGVKFLGQ